MTIVRRLLPAFTLLAVGAITWWGLSDHQSAAPWVEVYAAPQAAPGASYPVRLRLAAERLPEAAQPLFVAVHLHGLTPDHAWHGFVSAAQPQSTAAPDAEFEFNLMLPEDKTSGFIFLLVYVSPTGGWGARVAAARSDAIPVLAGVAGENIDRLQPVPVYSRAVEQEIIRRDSTSIRVLLAMGWLTCAGICWRLRPGTIPTIGRRRRLPVLPLLAAIVAVWELLPLEQILGERARAFATAHDWYDSRGGFQQVTTVTIAVVMAAIIMFLLPRSDRITRQLPLIGLTLHLGITSASFLSLHRVDAILALSVLSLSLIQIIQLGALLLALIGVANVMRRGEV